MRGSWAGGLRVLTRGMRRGRVLMGSAALAALVLVGWLAVPRAAAVHYLDIARAGLARGDGAAARSAIAQALASELPPYQRGIVLGELGRLLLGEGKSEEARTVLQQAVALAPGEPQIHVHLATLLARAGQQEQAAYHQQRAQQIRVEYERVSELSRQLVHRPDDPGLRFQAGEILLRQGLRDEALRWLASALACDPHHGPTHALLAQFYAEKGDAERAAYHRLKAGPSHPALQAPSGERSPPSAALSPGATSEPGEGKIKGGLSP